MRLSLKAAVICWMALLLRRMPFPDAPAGSSASIAPDGRVLNDEVDVAQSALQIQIVPARWQYR